MSAQPNTTTSHDDEIQARVAQIRDLKVTLPLPYRARIVHAARYIKLPAGLGI